MLLLRLRDERPYKEIAQELGMSVRQVKRYLARGYERLNRDEAGGALADLVPALDAHLAAGRRRVVLDNTYGARAARSAVLEAAWARGVPVRVVHLRTSLEDAQVNAVARMVERHGRLLEPDEMKAAARKDPSVLAPGSVSPSDERPGNTSPMQPIHARGPGEAPGTIRQTRTIDVAGARATPVERIHRVE